MSKHKSTILDYKKSPKLGLVLEGGGVKGAYQFGALKALFDAGFRFDGVTGTSIGALNGALLVEGGFSKMQEFWADVKVSKLFDIDDDTVEKVINNDIDKLWMGKVGQYVKNFRQIINSSSDKMHSYFSSFYDERKIRNSEMDFGLVTYSVSERKPAELFKEEIPDGQLVDYLIASACFPVYRFQKIGEEYYVDGGVYDNMPVNLLAKKGYKDIIVIRTKDKEPKRKLLYDDLNLFFITPCEDLGRPVVFTEDRIEYIRSVGYYDALRALNGYMGTKFYILPYDEKKVMSLLHNIDTNMAADVVEKLTDVRPRHKDACLRELFFIIREELNLHTADQEIVFVTLFEIFGALARVDRFQVYDVVEFMRTVATEMKNKCGDTAEDFVLNTKALRNTKLREIFFIFSHCLG